jgi:HutP
MKALSMEVAKAAIQVAMTDSRGDEQSIIESYFKNQIKVVAVDIGGNLVDSIPKVIERSIISARRTGLIREEHVFDGAIAGAAKEAIMQVVAKALGLNVGGKIGIARSGEHLSVCVFMSIGLLHLNDVAIGLAHRSVPKD